MLALFLEKMFEVIFVITLNRNFNLLDLRALLVGIKPGIADDLRLRTSLTVIGGGGVNEVTKAETLRCRDCNGDNVDDPRE